MMIMMKCRLNSMIRSYTSFFFGSSTLDTAPFILIQVSLSAQQNRFNKGSIPLVQLHRQYKQPAGAPEYS